MSDYPSLFETLCPATSLFQGSDPNFVQSILMWISYDADSLPAFPEVAPLSSELSSPLPSSDDSDDSLIKKTYSWCVKNVFLLMICKMNDIVCERKQTSCLYLTFSI